MHPLDKPIWTALETRQTQFALGNDLARRFPADVSPFVAGLDTSAETASAMAALIPEGDDVSLLQVDPPKTPVGVVSEEKVCLQMVWAQFSAGTHALAIQPLGEADAAEMLALATLTRPGPFKARTHTMGRFLGVRESGQLIAMAGERLHVPGYREITAVCTHPDHRGKGLGAALMRAVGARMLVEGDTPFLHSYASNEPAVALYHRLGFETRTEVIHAVWKRA